jgi:pathogenesis-related protein 1
MKSYNTAVIIIVVTIISFLQPHALAQSTNAVTIIPDTTSIGSDLTVQEVEALLQAHNKARAEVGVSPLRWSKELAIYAQAWAAHLASAECRLEHRPRSGTWKQVYGENLFMGTAGYYDVADAVKAWEGEKTYYSGEPLNYSNWKDSGHYTQVVWKDTTHVGCAKAECKGNMLVVCNYDPPGNVLGQKPY